MKLNQIVCSFLMLTAFGACPLVASEIETCSGPGRREQVSFELRSERYENFDTSTYPHQETRVATYLSIERYVRTGKLCSTLSEVKTTQSATIGCLSCDRNCADEDCNYSYWYYFANDPRGGLVNHTDYGTHIFGNINECEAARSRDSQCDL